MPVEWTIEYDATTQPVADWGLVGLRLRRANMQPDTLTFRHEGALVDADPIFDYGETIKLYRDGVKWFEGRVDQVPRYGSASEEGMAYTIVGPWWYLERLVYQQGWNLDDGSGVSVFNGSHALLFHSITGTKLNVAEQLADALDYAIAAGKPLAYDNTDFPAVNPPVDEAQDIMCSEIIRRALRWAPDAVTWFDYSTSPPTLHIKQRADLTAVDMDIAATDYSLDNLQITDRPDLQVPAVHLKFEQTNIVDGQPLRSITEQKAPGSTITGTENGALVATIQLAGATLQRTSAAIECQTINTAEPTWWGSWIPWLAGPLVDIVDIAEVNRLSSLPRALTKGAVASWMRLANGTPVSAEKDTVSASIRVKYFSDETTHNDSTLVRDEVLLFSIELVATDAISDTYSTTVSASEAEAVPTGLAQHLYDATSTLQWQGSVDIREGDVAGRIGIGNTLNILSGRTAWETMAATVQETLEDIDGGTTRVIYGPPRHLGAADIIELLRINRFRRVYTNPAVRVDGVMRSSGNVTFSEDVLRGDAASGGAQPRRIRIGQKADPKKGEIDLDPSQGDVTTGTGSIFKLRWTKGCDSETGEDRYALVMRGPWVADLPGGAEVDE